MSETSGPPSNTVPIRRASPMSTSCSSSTHGIANRDQRLDVDGLPVRINVLLGKRGRRSHPLRPHASINCAAWPSGGCGTRSARWEGRAAVRTAWPGAHPMRAASTSPSGKRNRMENLRLLLSQLRCPQTSASAARSELLYAVTDHVVVVRVEGPVAQLGRGRRTARFRRSSRHSSPALRRRYRDARPRIPLSVIGGEARELRAGEAHVRIDQSIGHRRHAGARIVHDDDGAADAAVAPACCCPGR